MCPNPVFPNFALMNKRNLFLFIFFLTAFSSCKKEHQGVPNVFCDITIYVNDPQNISLSTVSGWKYFSGVNTGNRGVVVYRKSQTEFVAFDRTCPYKPDDASSIVEVDTSNNIILKDVSCTSQFLLSDGSPISGPAVVPLKQFKTVFDGTVLRVTN
jgi:nitrite reductase/ring-hydroxylating ferredoxin subunit